MTLIDDILKKSISPPSALDPSPPNIGTTSPAKCAYTASGNCLNICGPPAIIVLKSIIDETVYLLRSYDRRSMKRSTQAATVSQQLLLNVTRKGCVWLIFHFLAFFYRDEDSVFRECRTRRVTLPHRRKTFILTPIDLKGSLETEDQHAAAAKSKAKGINLIGILGSYSTNQ